MQSDNFVKTPGGMVINTNYDEYENYKRLRERSQRENKLKNEVTNLKDEISDLKKLIQDISSRIP